VVVSMIMRDDGHVIDRCIKSVVYSDINVIGFYIGINGVSEGLEKTLERCSIANRVPIVCEREQWQGFGINRQIALEKTKLKFPNAEYIMFIDADDTWEQRSSEMKFTTDNVYCMVEYGDLRYRRLVFTRNISTTPCSWWNPIPIHEAMMQEGNGEFSYCGVIKVIGGGTSHNNPNKYTEHACVFEEYLKKNPTNTRAQFYFAQSVFDAFVVKEPFAVKNEWGKVAIKLFMEYALGRNGDTQERYSAAVKAWQYRKFVDDTFCPLYLLLIAILIDPSRPEAILELDSEGQRTCDETLKTMAFTLLMEQSKKVFIKESKLFYTPCCAQLEIRKAQRLLENKNDKARAKQHYEAALKHLASENPGDQQTRNDILMGIVNCSDETDEKARKRERKD